MKNTWLQIALAASTFFISTSCVQQAEPETNRQRMDLAGRWAFQLDSLANFPDSLSLPGTTDTNRKGVKNNKMDETTYLSRAYSYKGKAWYRKTVQIPAEWQGQTVRLFMERTKPTEVFVDGKLVGRNDDISVPQVYDLSAYLAPGEHTITIMVDNGESVPPQLLGSSHAYTESTQTNWNGIIGDFYLEAADACHIADVQVYPDYEQKTATVRVTLAGTDKTQAPIKLSCGAETWNTDITQRIKAEEATLPQTERTHTFTLDLGENAATWSEFDPALYRVTVALETGEMRDVRTADFGLRDFRTRGTKFVINDKTIFLRGKHDACVFPLTAHTAMDVDTWRHYFQVAKQYGINHYRFHSWCPPEACFEAADIEGIYLQPELPFWGSLNQKDTTLIAFLRKEGIRIQREYSNHASFVMFAIGNEIWGEQPILEDLVGSFRQEDNRHLYAYGSNNGLGFAGQQAGEDYMTTCRVGQLADTSFVTHARASFSFADAYDGGYMNHTYPNTVMNFDSAVARCTVPIISHETGQYQVYPNYDEMKKYTGVLEPRNFAVFKARLEEAGMLPQAHDFFLASGKWSAALYRAEIEMDLRTRGLGGFQLLDLQDYPGQGSAFVGILDAFMDSKGLITPEEWRQSCNTVVPLFESPSYTHSADKPLTGKVMLSNYSEDEVAGTLAWTLADAAGQELFQGSWEVSVAQGEVAEVGSLDIDLSSISEASRYTLSLELQDTPYRNTYPVWVYPADIDTTPADDILVAKKWNHDLIAHLRAGGKVLWFPEANDYPGATVGALFQTDYWNYRMFKTICENAKKPVSPGTMGLLINEKHPVFQNFPTEFHTNWQWFPIVKQSHPMILDRLPADYRPIVQPIDNIERNHKLGLLFELEVEGGKLLICMSDLASVQDKPEARQFYAALLRYMESDAFKPTLRLKADDIPALFRAPDARDEIKTLRNISYD